MWKKDEPTTDTPRQGEVTEKPESRGPRTVAAEQATIGRSITIRGEVSGDEDLLIQGKVDGSVDLEQHSVTVGREGRVNANITGRVVTVEGEVEGDLEAQEQIILRAAARVKGDITAPRVVLEDGARFQGLVDMGEPSESDERGKGESAVGGRSAKGTLRTAGAEPGKAPVGSAGSSRDSTTPSPPSTDRPALRPKDKSDAVDEAVP